MFVFVFVFVFVYVYVFVFASGMRLVPHKCCYVTENRSVLHVVQYLKTRHHLLVPRVGQISHCVPQAFPAEQQQSFLFTCIIFFDNASWPHTPLMTVAKHRPRLVSGKGNTCVAQVRSDNQ